MKNNFITRKEDIQEKGIYRFVFSEEYKQQNSNKNLYHCFDGILIPSSKTYTYGFNEKNELIENNNKTFTFSDTYWGNGEVKFRSFEELLSKGNISLICNMDEVEPIEEKEIKYYKDKDIVNLSRHHGHYKRFFKHKNAIRDKQTIINLIDEKQTENTRKLKSLQEESSRLSTLKNSISILENLDGVYL